MKHFRFSIVIPCFNSSNTIINCLESCFSQTYQNFNIIIVDDSSMDNTCSIIKRYIVENDISSRVTLIELKENNGPSNARNIGINQSNSDYIALLDSDDCFLNNKLEVINNILINNPNIDLIGHAYQIGNHNHLDMTMKLRNVSLPRLIIRNFAVTPSIVFKRNISTRFDTSFRYAEDHNFFIKAKTSGYNVYYLDCVLVKLNRPVLSDGGLSSNKLKMRIGEIKMYTNLCFNNPMLFVLYPFLLLLSILKHIVKTFCGLLLKN